MSCTLPRLALLLTLVAGTAVAAPPLPLDLIPQDAALGLSARNLTDFAARANKLFGRRVFADDAATEFSRDLKLAWKVDTTKPLAVICATGKLGGFDADARAIDKHSLGVSVAFPDRDEMLRVWRLRAGVLDRKDPVEVPGAAITLPGLFGPGQTLELKHGLFDPDRVTLSESADAVAAWRKARTLRDGLGPARQKRLDAADALFYIGNPMWRVVREFNADNDWSPPELNERETEAYRRTQRVWREVDELLAAAYLQEGLGMDINVRFDPRGKESQTLLKAFNTGDRFANLAGLPAEKVIAAFSMVGVDEKNLDVARLLATQIWFGPGDASPLLASDAVAVRRIVGNLYGRLQLVRAALYPVREKTAGQLGLVAVLEPKDAESFLKEIAAMARAANEKEFAPTGTGKAEIEKLVADLSSDDFDVREAASTKLGLIGPAVLPFLEKAEKSTDAEARRRAGDLRREIEQVAALRKQEKAGGLLQKAFHPSFAWKASAEERLGVKVHHLTMRFDAVDAPYATWLKEVFGPDWARIRLAVVGGKVVALLGSDVTLFEQAIANVRDKKPGLEASAALASFHKHASSERRAELHLAAQRIQALTTPAHQLPRDFQPTDDISSFGLRTGTAELGLDSWFPRSAVPVLVPWLGF
jgi:hypothetical protein